MKTRLAVWVAVPGVAALVWAGALLWAQAEQTAELTRELRGLQQNVLRLEQQAASAPRRRSQAPATSEIQRSNEILGQDVVARALIAASSSVAALDNDDGRAELDAELEPPDSDEAATHLTNAFDTQTADSSWSRSAEKRATLALSEHLEAGSSLQGVECRDTLCQVRSSHADRDGYGKFVDGVVLSRADGLWNGAFATFITEAEAGGLEAVTFIAREGAELPSSEND